MERHRNSQMGVMRYGNRIPKTNSSRHSGILWSRKVV